MALDFGKLNFSVSFNPTSAFPLDARCYFESYSEALKAAKSAVEAGGTDSVYYYGQTLVVVENDKARFYIIQPNKTLSEVAVTSDGITVNPKLFEYDKNGNLSLKGFDTAALSSVLTVGPSGTIVWSEVYNKNETDAQIAAAVSAAAHLKRKIVSSKYDIDISATDADQFIYMVPSTSSNNANKYDEYMVLVLTQNGQEVRFIEQVGSWDVDLTNYVTKEALNTALSFKVDKVEGSRLMTKAEAEKLASLENSLIKSVNDKQFKVTDGKLNLLEIAITEVTDLSDILNQGIETAGGYSLVSKEDKQKLNQLVINPENGSLEISGTVNANQVLELAEWITEHSTGSDFVPGLSKHSLTDERLAKLDKAITSEFIKSVGPEFEVSEGKLNLKSISMSQVEDLTEALEDKVNVDKFLVLSATVEGHTKDVRELRQLLTWAKI